MLDFLNYIALIIIGVATIIQLLDMVGWIPYKLRKKFKLSKASDTIDVLKEFGIDINMYKRKNSIVGVPHDYSKNSVEEDTRRNLELITINKPISVGHLRKTELNYYIDLIGYSCNEDFSKNYARLLTSYWSEIVEETCLVKSPNFDFVVTPKGGSPILGYEFSKLVKKPFVLHEEHERFTSPVDDIRKYFDFSEIPPEGSVALIVDDSTTGGYLVLDTVAHLRERNYIVTECLVVFEPQNKDARRKLSDKEVNLISIVKTHNSNKG